MQRFTLHLLILAVLTGVVIGEEWYIPNSNMISDKQFPQKVKEDHSSFKFIKYFTPHCPYCRYLKDIFDKLKVQKEWCFKIYDFNCKWYPQFCMQNVRSTSFPYTAIHNGQGQLYQQIHGFYPQPIILQIFQRIDTECRKLQQPAANSQVKVEEKVVTQQQKHEQVVVKQEQKVVEQVKDVKQQKVQSSSLSAQKQQEKVIQTYQQDFKGEAKTKQQQVNKQSQEVDKGMSVKQMQQLQKKPSALPPYISYIFYSVCIILAIYYIYSMSSKGEQDAPLLQSPQSDGQRNSNEDSPKKQNKNEAQRDPNQPVIEETQLLADQQL